MPRNIKALWNSEHSPFENEIKVFTCINRNFHCLVHIISPFSPLSFSFHVQKLFKEFCAIIWGDPGLMVSGSSATGCPKKIPMFDLS